MVIIPKKIILELYLRQLRQFRLFENEVNCFSFSVWLNFRESEKHNEIKSLNLVRGISGCGVVNLLPMLEILVLWKPAVAGARYKYSQGFHLVVPLSSMHFTELSVVSQTLSNREFRFYHLISSNEWSLERETRTGEAWANVLFFSLPLLRPREQQGGAGEVLRHVGKHCWMSEAWQQVLSCQLKAGFIGETAKDVSTNWTGVLPQFRQISHYHSFEVSSCWNSLYFHFHFWGNCCSLVSIFYGLKGGLFVVKAWQQLFAVALFCAYSSTLRLPCPYFFTVGLSFR